MREPLVLPALALAGGIALSRFVSFDIRELVLPLAAFPVLSFLASARGSSRLARLCACLAVFFAGILTEIRNRPGPPPELDAGPEETVILSGCVVEPPVDFDDYQRFVLELAPKARARVNLYRRVGEPAPSFGYGQVVEVEARVRRPRNLGNPGSFDYEGYLARQSIYWTATARSASRALGNRCGSRFQAFLFHVRDLAIQRLDRLYAGDSYAIGMMRAILIGDNSRLEKVWTDHFRFTGTYHAIVISGLHLTALVAVVLFAFRLCPSADIAVLPIAGAMAWVYALVTGFQTPVVRAAAGLTLYLIARFFFRRRRLLNLLSAVALVFLALDPHQLFEASFQLSFLSVVAIAALAIPILEKTSVPLARALDGLDDVARDVHFPPKSAQFRVELRLLAETLSLATRLRQRWLLAAFGVVLRFGFYCYELAAVSAAVQVGLALPMAIYFHRISLSGLSANILVVPLMSLLVPAGFLAVFTGWSLAASVAGWLLAASRSIVDWHVRIEPAWRIPDPPAWLAVAVAGSLVLVCLALRRSRAWRVASLAALAGLLAALLAHPFPPHTEPGALELTAIDVGQGESLLVAFPSGKLMVMDGGGFPSFGRKAAARLDTGEDVVSPYLWSRSIQRLDVVAMSHAHHDHMGGLGAILDNFRPAELWTGAVPDSPAWQALRAKARQNRIAIRPLRSGDAFAYGGARVEVLAPPYDYRPAAEPQNNDSLALCVRYGSRSFLLAGEIENEIESVLLDRGNIGHADVLKVAHHGSRTSTTEEFFKRVRPVLAVVSAGFQNRYGYPHPEIIDRASRYHATLLRTDLSGLVTVRTDGRRLWMDMARWSANHCALDAPFPDR